MWDFYLSKAIGILIKTWPFIAFRMIVYFGIALGYLLAVGTGAGTGWLLHYLSSDPDAGTTYTAWGGIAGFGLISAVLYWVREYILYLVKAGHIAVMVELLDGRAIPNGRGQIDYAQAMVRERFAEASVLFAIDQLVKGVVGAITGTVQAIGSFLPVPGIDTVLKFVNSVVRVSLTYVDELILGYMFRLRTENPYATGRDGLVLFAQNYWSFVKNAISVTLVMYVMTLIIFIVVLAPALALAAILPGAWTAWGIIIAAIFAFSFKAAFLEPLAIACLMQVYFKKIEGQVPDPVWDGRLQQLSRKFQELKEKALGAGPRPQAA